MSVTRINKESDIGIFIQGKIHQKHLFDAVLVDLGKCPEKRDLNLSCLTYVLSMSINVFTTTINCKQQNLIM